MFGMLTYARCEEGADVPLKPHAVSAVAAEVVENAAFEAQKKRVKVVLEDDLPDGLLLPLNVKTLQCALENILRNGLRHSPEGSRLAVKLSSMRSGVRIAVCDQGPGMPPEDLEHAFDPFVRGRNESTGTGFGLGLAIARRAVLAHGGSIEARNLSVGGLEVAIDLPTPGSLLRK